MVEERQRKKGLEEEEIYTQNKTVLVGLINTKTKGIVLHRFAKYNIVEV